MSKVTRLKEVAHDWGGSTAAFFAYAHSSHDLCPALIAPLLPLIRAGLGLTYLQSALLLSAYAITSGLSQFLGGWLADRMSRRVVVAVGLGGVGFATLAAGLNSTYHPLLAIFVAMGIFSGAYHPSATTMLSGEFERERRGKVIGLHMVGGSLGYTLGPVLGGLLADRLGWSFAFVILSLPAMVAAPLALNRLGRLKGVSTDDVVSPAPAADGSMAEVSNERLGLLQVLRPVAAVGILAVFTQLVAGSAMAFIPLYLVDKHAVLPVFAALSLGVVRGGGMVGGLFGGWLSDKWTRRNSIILVLASTGPILYLLTILPANASLVLVLIAFGLLMSMRQSTVLPYLMDATPSRLRATVFGIYFGLSMEGLSMMQPVAGHFMDILGITQVFHIISLMNIGLSLTALIVAGPRILSRRLS